MSASLKDIAYVKRVFRQKDYNRFAQISGDDNLTHVDPEFAATTRFGRTLAHGMQLYSYICRLLSTQLPGPGTLQISQELMFPSGVYVGDEITFTVEMLGKDDKTNTATLKTTCLSPVAEALVGTSKVLLPDAGKIAYPGVDESIGKYASSEGDKLKGMFLGQEEKSVRTFTEEDIENYASLTGDQNPLCLDIDYAKKRGLKGCLVPGALLNGMFSMLMIRTLLIYMILVLLKKGKLSVRQKALSLQKKWQNKNGCFLYLYL
jgi:acyl dehydratase